MWVRLRCPSKHLVKEALQLRANILSGRLSEADRPFSIISCLLRRAFPIPLSQIAIACFGQDARLSMLSSVSGSNGGRSGFRL